MACKASHKLPRSFAVRDQWEGAAAWQHFRLPKHKHSRLPQQAAVLLSKQTDGATTSTCPTHLSAAVVLLSMIGLCTTVPSSRVAWNPQTTGTVRKAQALS